MGPAIYALPRERTSRKAWPLHSVCPVACTALAPGCTAVGLLPAGVVHVRSAVPSGHPATYGAPEAHRPPPTLSPSPPPSALPALPPPHGLPHPVYPVGCTPASLCPTWGMGEGECCSQSGKRGWPRATGVGGVTSPSTRSCPPRPLSPQHGHGGGRRHTCRTGRPGPLPPARGRPASSRRAAAARRVAPTTRKKMAKEDSTRTTLNHDKDMYLVVFVGVVFGRLLWVH